MTTKIGDYFSIPLNDGRFGIGLIVQKVSPALYIGALKAVFEREEVFDPSVLEDPQDFGFFGCFFDSKIKNGDWKILGNRPVNSEIFPKPYLKIKRGDNYEVETIDKKYVRRATGEDILRFENPSNKAPKILENAINAFYGLHDSDIKYEKVSADFIRQRSTL